MNELGDPSTEQTNQEHVQSARQGDPTGHETLHPAIKNVTSVLITIAADRFADPLYMGSRVRLRFAVDGALSLASALATLASCNGAIDAHDEGVTKQNLKDIFADVAASAGGSDINLFLILSGHGDEANGQQWFCTYDARPDRVDLTGGELADLVKLTPACSVTAIFDFCHAGGVAAEFHRALTSWLSDAAILVLAGTTAEQLAYEHPALGRGLFTIAVHEAITDRRFYALATARTAANAVATASKALRSELAGLFVFARERTEQLAYLYASGRRQTPEIYGSGRVGLTWTADAVGPPLAPEPRRALAGRLRKIFGWSASLAFLTGILLFLLQYHLAVGPDGWLEVRGGPPWMSSLVPQGLKAGVQLPIVIGDLAAPARNWDERRISQRAELVAGEVGGLTTHTIEGRENWEFKLWPELSREAQRRIDFALGRGDLASVCAAKDAKRDRARDYQFALEAALLDRQRSCPPAFYLEQGPEVGELYAIKNPNLDHDFSLTDLSDQAIQMYLAGLSLAYRELDDGELRRRALEAAILLVSIRAKNRVLRDTDWLTYMRFLEDVAASRRLDVVNGVAATFPRLSACVDTWCDLAAKLTTFVTAGAAAAGVGNGAGMMIWLMARHTDRQAAEGDGAHSWALPALLLLARHGELGEAEFDLIIRYFKFIVPNSEQIWIEPIWLPRFARVLKFPSSLKGGLGRCAFHTAGSRVACSDFDADIAANILNAQGRFLGTQEQAKLVERLDKQMPQDRVALYGSQIRDIGCWSKLPARWLSALERSLDYQLRIAPARANDPLTGVTVVEVTDLAAAHALAVSVQNGYNMNTEQVARLARYVANHWSYEGLQTLFRSLGAALMTEKALEQSNNAGRLIASFPRDALARSALLEAQRADRGLLYDPLVANGPSYLRLDAVLAAKHQIAQYTFELDKFCER